MPHKLNHLLFTFAFWLMALTGFAQTFPVTISTQINQPSPIYWSNYADATTSNSPIKIQIVLNDLTISNRQVRIKCYWQGNGISFMNNDFVVGAQPLFLEGGVPLQLTNVNLAPYFEFQNIIGITPNQYAQAMPEGIYTFSVEVYDVATGQKLSRKSNVTAVIFQNEPPLLNLPLNKARIMQQNIQNIVFSWTPRQINVSNVEYQFDLVEIWDQYTPVQNAFAYSPPIYTTTTRATTLQYGVAEPQLIPGKRYAWRIKAKALVGAEEIGVFKNNGYSEIFAFSYDVYCTPPLQIATDGVSQDQAKVTWSGALDNFDYQVNYREKNADSQWYPLETPREYATLANLKANTTYEYTVGAACEKGKYVHSSLQEFTTLAQDEIALVTCGIRPDPVDLSNLNPLDNLVPNDVIKAGDFPIVVIEATGTNGRFTGEGYVTLPLLEKYRKLIDAADNIGEIPKKIAGIVTDATTVATALANHGATQVNNVATKVKDITGETINIPTQGVIDQIKNTGALISDKANALADMAPDYSTNIGQYTRIAVSFTDIGVNTNFKLIAGEIKASYDPEWKSMIDLDPAFNKVFGDAGNVVNYEIDFDIETVIKNPDGSITITSTTGVVTVIEKTVNDIVITDKDGTQYTIPANAPVGPIKPSGQLAPGGVPTAANTNGMGAGGIVKQISSPDVSVVFTKGNGKYAFDTEPTTQKGKLNKTYKSIPQKSGGTYSIPFKAISNSPDSTDVLVAIVDFKNGKTKDDIVFKTQNGTLIKSTWNENTAILNLKRTLDYAKETVIAAVRPTPTVQQNPTGSTPPAGTTPIKPTDNKNSPKYDIAGTFNLWHLTHKKINVTLVSVNGAPIPVDAASTLNEIYEPTGITFNVNTIPVTLDHFWGEKIETGNSDLLNTYTPEQQALTLALKTALGAEYTTDTYYMLYTNEGAENKDAGFMPLKRQFGFVFDGKNKTLAHELGHGVFGLQHAFKQYDTPKGSTNLLMDYGEGTTLNHNDWEIIHAPGLQLYQFTQGSSAGALAGGYALAPDWRFVSNGDEKTVAYLSLAQKGFLGGLVKGDKKYKWSTNKYVSIEDATLKIETIASIADGSKIYLFFDNDKPIKQNKYLRTVYNKELKDIISAKNSDLKALSSYIDKYATPANFRQKDEKRTLYWGYVGCSNCDSDGVENGNGSGGLVIDKTAKIPADELKQLIAQVSTSNQVNGINAKIFITAKDDTKGIAEVEKAIADLEKSNSREIYIWAKNYVANANFDLELAYGKGLSSKEKLDFDNFEATIQKINNQKESWLACLKFEGTYTYFNPLTAMLDGLAGLIGKAAIPAKYYNPDEPDYNPLPAKIYAYASGKIISEANSTDKYRASRQEFALLCGTWNGLVGTVEAIPAGVSMLMKLQGSAIDVIINHDGARDKLIKTLSNINKEQIDQILSTIGDEIEKGYKKYTKNPCMVSYASGQAVFVVASLFIGAGEANAAKTFLQTLEKLDVAGQLMGKALMWGGKLVKPILNPISKKIKFALAEGVQFIRDTNLKIAPSSNLYCGFPVFNVKLIRKGTDFTSDELRLLQSKVDEAIKAQGGLEKLPLDEFDNRIVEIDIDGEKIPVIVGTESGLSKIDDGVSVQGVGSFAKYTKIDGWLKGITNATSRANVENIIKNWSDDLLTKLDNVPSRNPNFLSQVEANPSILNHFEDGASIISSKGSGLKPLELDMYALDKARPIDKAVITPGTNSYKINSTRKSFDNMPNSSQMDINPQSGKIRDVNGNVMVTDNVNGEGLMYAIDESGNIWIGGRGGEISYPHPTLVGGVNPNVKCAGMIKFKDGRVLEISNNSGHFKPTNSSLQEAETLFKQKLPANSFDSQFKTIGF